MSSYSKTLANLAKNDERFADYSHEGEDGHWLYTATGWGVVLEQVHCIHEYRVKDILERLDEVERCGCRDCFTGSKFELGRFTVKVSVDQTQRSLLDVTPDFIVEVLDGAISIGSAPCGGSDDSSARIIARKILCETAPTVLR